MASQISPGTEAPRLQPTSAFRNVLILVVTAVVLATLVFVLLVPHVRQRLVVIKKGTMADMTKMAVGVLAHYDRMAAEGRMTMAEAQQAAIEHLRGIRFGADRQGYFWINDQRPRLLMHPHRTDLEGRDVSALTDEDGQRMVSDSVDAVAGPQAAGFIAYRWQRPHNTGPALPKISHVRLYPSWGWIVGGGAYLQDIHLEIAGLKTRLVAGGLVVTVVVGLIVALLTRDAVKIDHSRRQVWKMLRENEQKYRNLVENASDAIFVTQDGVIKFPNRRMIEVSGYDARALAGLSFVDLIHPDDRSLIATRHQKRLGGEPVSDTVSFRGYNRDGRLIWLELNAVTVEWEGRPAVLNFLRDVSERKRLEAEIQQAQRLESLATLSGGVAHEFNNLLMGIMGNTALMRLDLDTGHPHWKRLDDIEHSVHSGAELTKQLLGFARGARFTLQPSDLNQVVKDALSIFKDLHREVAVECRLQANLWPVVMDRGQIGDVLRRLLTNAEESMPDGGKIVVVTENTLMKEDQFRPGELRPGRYARVTVRDSGIGMDETTQGRVFEPFFTTRRMGNGVGLGLAAAYGIVRGHEGLITVASREGAGATFEVYLPAADEHATVEPI
jgi:PAS domain S-box-containing protein